MPNKMAEKHVTSNIASARNQSDTQKRFSFLIGPNYVVCYGIKIIPTFLSGIERHFKRSVDKLTLETLQRFPYKDHPCVTTHSDL